MSNRRDQTFSACDALSASGVKPSLQKVKAWKLQHLGPSVVLGSDGDTQADIHAWYSDAFSRLRTPRIPDLPESVSDLAQQLWRTAIDAAAQAGQAELDAKRAEMDAAIDQARNDAAKAQEREKEASEALAEIRALNEMLRQQLIEAAGKVTGRDEEIKKLIEEAAQKEQAFQMALGELRIELTSHDTRATAAEERAIAAELRAERAEERYLGAERRLKVETDAIRQELLPWKKNAEDAEAQVQLFQKKAAEAKEREAAANDKIHALDMRLAEAQGRLAVLDQQQVAARSRLDETEKQLRTLEVELAVARRAQIELAAAQQRVRELEIGLAVVQQAHLSNSREGA